jgi:methionyl-tRNA synthetase
VHFFGYDNSFYHAVLYPALYRLAYPQWTPDIDYHVNEFLLLDGEKFSTSRRHAVWGKEVLGPHSVDAVRFFLARIRPEGRRTDYRSASYEAVLRDTLVGTWQRWLNDLGARVRKYHDGRAPGPGMWTPEHTAFRGRLEARLAALTASLQPGGFSLNHAAGELAGIVADAVRFGAAERAVTGIGQWRAESRTAVALELAAVRLLATGAAPVLPRFARRLSAALGLPAPDTWPAEVALVPAGAPVDLARAVFFGAPPEGAPAQGAPAEPATADEPLSTWLRGVVRTTLQLPDDAPVDDRTLAELGVESLHMVALQYQILEHTGVDIRVEDLLGERNVAALAGFIADRRAGAGVRV